MESSKHLTIKEWAEEDKPREKMLQKGKKELSNAELIGILLGSGTPDRSAVSLAKELLEGCGNSLSELSRKGITELMHKYKGIGSAKAVTVIAALELGYRLLNENRLDGGIFIHDSKDLFNYISHKLIDLPHEEFWAVYMNTRNKVLSHKQISTGGITDTPVDTRIIFKGALERNAVKIALVHNHPSGSLNPSGEDRKLTHRLVEAGKILNISIVEHIIVGIDYDNKPNYYSFFDNGLLV